uniref:DNA2/NAM7 helicase-like C-terminal domain-containing protein n=1 Tax=Dendroctonus ponderosae TaxID=77166 RepID=A0AAR5QKK2_DENPD
MLNFPKSQEEPPIFWVPRKQNVSQTVCEVIVDLCAAKGIKPSDICVIPFLQNEMLSIEAINLQICQKCVEKAFRPECISDVEYFLTNRKPYEFLFAWALRVKGLEFKVVVMVIDEDQFDYDNVDDRKKVYVICSRCTCMLIVISDDQNRREIALVKYRKNTASVLNLDAIVTWNRHKKMKK